MKININKKFWDSSNFLARTCFIIGAFFMDLAMRFSGLESEK